MSLFSLLAKYREIFTYIYSTEYLAYMYIDKLYTIKFCFANNNEITF